MKKIILIFVIIFIIGLGTALILNFKVLIEETIYYPMDVNIVEDDHISLNLDENKLHFGNIPINSLSAYRNMHFNNLYPYPMKIIITSDRPMAEWLTYNIDELSYKNKIVFYLEPGKSQTVKYILNIPNNSITTSQYYDGKNKIVWKRKTIFDSFFELISLKL
ncbi:MAG: hypothetical protein ABIF40_03840 [archaeon]